MADFATRQELADWLQTSVSNAQADLVLATASADIRDHCGWHISPAVVGATYTVPWTTAHVMLPTRYLTAATALYSGSPVTLTFAARGLVEASSGYLTTGTVITYTHGYAATPDTVKKACLMLAAEQIVNPDRVRSRTIAGYSEAFDESSDEDDPMSLLRPYRRLRFGVA